MANAFEVRILSNRLPQLIEAVSRESAIVVRDTAREIEGLWANDVRVDTGRLRASIMADQIEDPEGGEEETWVVDTPVDYAFYNEFGSATISAKPSARDAADKGVGEAEQRLSTMAERLLKVGQR